VDSVLTEHINNIIEVLIFDLNESEKGNRAHYKLLIEYLNAGGLYDKAKKWAENYLENYKNEDEPLKLMLKIGYDSNDKKLFEETARTIKKAEFPIRKSTMELVEYWKV
jgi:geranylgeranyl pyrophosphate synthase